MFVDAMANRNRSKSRSPPSAARRDSGRLAQASSVSAPAQPAAPAPSLAVHCDSHAVPCSDSRQSAGPFLLMPGPQVVQSPFARPDSPTYRGDLPLPAPAPVSGPAPPIHLANPDPFARARIAAVQSRVGAPTLSEPATATSCARLLTVPRWSLLVQQVPTQRFRHHPGTHAPHHSPARRLHRGRVYLRLVHRDRTRDVHSSCLRGLQTRWCPGLQFPLLWTLGARMMFPLSHGSRGFTILPPPGTMLIRGMNFDAKSVRFLLSR